MSALASGVELDCFISDFIVRPQQGGAVKRNVFHRDFSFGYRDIRRGKDSRRLICDCTANAIGTAAG